MLRRVGSRSVPGQAGTGVGLRRVLLLNYEYPPLGGGAGVTTAALAERLASRGVAVDVLTARSTARAQASGAGKVAADMQAEVAADVEAEVAPRVVRVPSLRRSVHEAGMLAALTYVLSARPELRRLLRANEYDVAHFFFSLPTGSLLPLVRRAGVPTVVSLRGSDVPGYDPWNRSLQIFHWAMMPVTRWIWRNADEVVAVTRSLGELAREGVPDLEFSVISNGVDAALFCPRAERGPDRSPITCIAVTRLVERKGLSCLLQAVRLLGRADLRLEIVGAGGYRDECSRLVASLGLEGQVTLLGALDHPALAERLRRADIFTLAPLAEAFGNAFAEAMATGLPVVGSDVGGIPDLVENGVNGLLVPAGDPQRLAEAIGELAGDPQVRAEMGVRNREKAVSLLSWDRMADDYMEVYGRTRRRA